MDVTNKNHLILFTYEDGTCTSSVIVLKYPVLYRFVKSRISTSYFAETNRFRVFNLVFVPPFVTKVMEFSFSVWFFFFRQISNFQLSIFHGIFLSFKEYCCPEPKFERTFRRFTGVWRDYFHKKKLK